MNKGEEEDLMKETKINNYDGNCLVQLLKRVKKI